MSAADSPFSTFSLYAAILFIAFHVIIYEDEKLSCTEHGIIAIARSGKRVNMLINGAFCISFVSLSIIYIGVDYFVVPKAISDIVNGVCYPKHYVLGLNFAY